MKLIHVILKTPAEPDYLEASALTKTGLHFIFGNVHTVVGNEKDAINIAKIYEKRHPDIRCTIIPLTIEEALQIGTAAEFEKMVSDPKFIREEFIKNAFED